MCKVVLDVKANLIRESLQAIHGKAWRRRVWMSWASALKIPLATTVLEAFNLL
jgi:hypothetical protein